MIIHGDCLEIMRTFADNHFTSILTDPPYGLRFMNKAWDRSVPGKEFWTEALRICKPGSIMLCFGGTRTYHRLTCAIEDAGWKIRDCLMWLYGSGFPKSHNHFGFEGYGTALKPAYEPIIMAMKPIKLLEYLLNLIVPAKDALILDPFAGSGSTCVAAKKLGLECIGIEISEEYCEIARKREVSVKNDDQMVMF